PAEEVRLVAVAQEHVGPEALQPCPDLTRRRPQPRGVVLQLHPLEAGAAQRPEEGSAPSSLGKGEKDRARVLGHPPGQPERLPLPPAEERGRGQVNDVHQTPLSSPARAATHPHQARSSRSANASQSYSRSTWRRPRSACSRSPSGVRMTAASVG